jgi:hypothetical protein
MLNDQANDALLLERYFPMSAIQGIREGCVAYIHEIFLYIFYNIISPTTYVMLTPVKRTIRLETP